MKNAISLTARLNAVSGLTPMTMTYINNVMRNLLIPLFGILCFLALWSAAAQNINTSLGKFPGPQAVWNQFSSLYTEHKAEREKEEAFYERQEKRNATRVAEDPNYVPKVRAYTGKETFLDQIVTSLITVIYSRPSRTDRSVSTRRERFRSPRARANVSSSGPPAFSSTSSAPSSH